jgi:hypothetical protein
MHEDIQLPFSHHHPLCESCYLMTPPAIQLSSPVYDFQSEKNNQSREGHQNRFITYSEYLQIHLKILLKSSLFLQTKTTGWSSVVRVDVLVAPPIPGPRCFEKVCQNGILHIFLIPIVSNVIHVEIF